MIGEKGAGNTVIDAFKYQGDKKGKMTVPNLVGKSGENAVGILAGMGLRAEFTPEIETAANVTIIDQFPKPGTKTVSDSLITLYYEVSEDVVTKDAN